MWKLGGNLLGRWLSGLDEVALCLGVMVDQGSLTDEEWEGWDGIAS